MQVKRRARTIQLPSKNDVWDYLGVRCQRVHPSHEVFAVKFQGRCYFGNARQTRVTLARIFTEAEKKLRED